MLRRADYNARGDAIMWVTPGAAAGPSSGAALQAAVRTLHDLQSDLAHLLRLRKREAEYQARPCPSLAFMHILGRPHIRLSKPPGHR